MRVTQKASPHHQGLFIQSLRLLIVTPAACCPGNIFECRRNPWMFRRKHFAPHRQTLPCCLLGFIPLAFTSQNDSQVAQRIRHLNVFHSEQFLSDSQCFPCHRLRLREPSLVPVHSTQIIERGGSVRVLRP